MHGVEGAAQPGAMASHSGNQSGDTVQGIARPSFGVADQTCLPLPFPDRWRNDYPATPNLPLHGAVDSRSPLPFNLLHNRVCPQDACSRGTR